MHAIRTTRPPGGALMAMAGAVAMASVLAAAGCGQAPARPGRRSQPQRSDG